MYRKLFKKVHASQNIYREKMKKKIIQDYMKGKITISKTANMIGITISEMEQYLVDEGYKSSYSIGDLNEELKLLSKLKLFKKVHSLQRICREKNKT